MLDRVLPGMLCPTPPGWDLATNGCPPRPTPLSPRPASGSGQRPGPALLSQPFAAPGARDSGRSRGGVFAQQNERGRPSGLCVGVSGLASLSLPFSRLNTSKCTGAQRSADSDLQGERFPG